MLSVPAIDEARAPSGIAACEEWEQGGKGEIEVVSISTREEKTSAFVKFYVQRPHAEKQSNRP